MKKFSVSTVAFSDAYLGEYEAETKEEAIELVFEEHGLHPSLCHHCSRILQETTLDDDEYVFVEEKEEV